MSFIESVSQEDYFEECEQEAQRMYGISFEDLGLDDFNRLAMYQDEGISPLQLIEEAGEKYGLIRIDFWFWHRW